MLELARAAARRRLGRGASWRSSPSGFAGIAATRSGRVLVRRLGRGAPAERGRRRAGAGAAQRTRAADRRERARRCSRACAPAGGADRAGRGACRRGARVRRPKTALREAERELAEAREVRAPHGLADRAAPQRARSRVRWRCAARSCEGELAAERRQAERLARERAQREQRIARLRARHAADIGAGAAARSASPRRSQSVGEGAERAAGGAGGAARARPRGRRAGGGRAARSAPHEEAEIQARLRDARRGCDRAPRSPRSGCATRRARPREELSAIAERLERPLPRDLAPAVERRRRDVARATGVSPAEAAGEARRGRPAGLESRRARA